MTQEIIVNGIEKVMCGEEYELSVSRHSTTGNAKAILITKKDIDKLSSTMNEYCLITLSYSKEKGFVYSILLKEDMPTRTPKEEILTMYDIFTKEEYKDLPKNFTKEEFGKDMRHSIGFDIAITEHCIIYVYEKYSQEEFNNMIIVTGSEEVVLFDKNTKNFKNISTR